MICSECQPRLSDMIDGHLSPGESLRMQQHLAACIKCSVVHQDISIIVSASRELPLLSPASLLWQQIQAEINGNPSHAPQAGFLARLWRRRFQINLSVPQLASAAALVVAMIVGLNLAARYMPGTLPGVNFNWQQAQIGTTVLSKPAAIIPPDLERSISTYDGQVREHMASWNPEMRDLFQRDMTIIDDCLEQSRHSLQEDPNDVVSQDMLRGTYDKKLKLLKDFSEF